jgi:hypothetical protein
MLRICNIGNRRFLHAEHCRYGTRDFSLFEKHLRPSELPIWQGRRRDLYV